MDSLSDRHVTLYNRMDVGMAKKEVILYILLVLAFNLILVQILSVHYFVSAVSPNSVCLFTLY